MTRALLVLLAVAWSAAAAAGPARAAGVGLVAVDLRTSAGWYRARPAAELWGEVGDTWRLRLSLASGVPQHEAGQGWAYAQGWQRVALTGAWTAGTRDLRFRAEAGPAVSRVATRWTSPAAVAVTQWAPGVRGGLGLDLPLADRWSLGGLAAATSRQRGVDLDLRVGASRTW